MNDSCGEGKVSFMQKDDRHNVCCKEYDMEYKGFNPTTNRIIITLLLFFYAFMVLLAWLEKLAYKVVLRNFYSSFVKGIL